MNRYYLYPGKVFASKKPHMVDTILGSCVAVFLWDSELNIGSINHYMLPVPHKEGEVSFKYGSVAIPEVIKRMLKMGSKKKDVKAKIFGGSETGNRSGVYHIGGRNIILAHDMLKEAGIPLISHSVGGSLGRKIIFNSSSGEVLVSYIKYSTGVAPYKKNASSFNLSEND